MFNELRHLLNRTLFSERKNLHCAAGTTIALIAVAPTVITDGEFLALPDLLESVRNQFAECGWNTRTSANFGFSLADFNLVITSPQGENWDITISVVNGIADAFGPDVSVHR